MDMINVKNTDRSDLYECFIFDYFDFDSRNLGFINTTIEGIRTSAQIKHVVIDITTKTPKNFKGSKLESVSARNPMITDSALIIISRPVVVSVMKAASL